MLQENARSSKCAKIGLSKTFFMQKLQKELDPICGPVPHVRSQLSELMEFRGKKRGSFALFARHLPGGALQILRDNL